MTAASVCSRASLLRNDHGPFLGQPVSFASLEPAGSDQWGLRGFGGLSAGRVVWSLEAGTETETETGVACFAPDLLPSCCNLGSILGASCSRFPPQLFHFLNDRMVTTCSPQDTQFVSAQRVASAASYSVTGQRIIAATTGGGCLNAPLLSCAFAAASSAQNSANASRPAEVCIRPMYSGSSRIVQAIDALGTFVRLATSPPLLEKQHRRHTPERFAERP